MSLPSARIQGVILVLVTLAVYYSSLFAPLNPLDDRALIGVLINQQNLSLQEVFSRTTDYYYRPVLWLTFWADYYLWGAEESFMHLGNVLLHAANVLLLFLCARQLPSQVDPASQWPPFLATFLFAIHPVNTEAVNWISARSDLLAGFFVLLSAYLLHRAIRIQRPLLAWASFVPLVPACLSKETALFFLPAALFIIYCYGRCAPGGRLTLRQSLVYGTPFLGLPLLYFVIRGPILLRQDAGAGLFHKLYELSLPSLTAVLGGIGFYTKKLFWPWPLNLTIDHVPAGYAFLGILVAVGLCVALWRRGELAGLLLASFCVGLSALLVILLRPAWTPVAERYLYIPSAFFCLAMVPVGEHLACRWSSSRLLPGVLAAVFALIVWTTVERNVLWQDNILLFEDAVRKSPDFPFAKSTLASLLREAGRKEEAAVIIQNNVAPADLRNADSLDLQRAWLLYENGRHVEARALVLAKRNKDRPLYYKFQEALLAIDAVLLGEISVHSPRDLLEEYVALHRELYAVYRDPFYLYRLGYVYWRLDDLENAQECFRQSAAEAPPGAHYRASAQLLAARLVKP